MPEPSIKTAELIISGCQQTGAALKLISYAPFLMDATGKTKIFGIVQSPSIKLFKILEEILRIENGGDGAEKPKRCSYPTSQLAVESQLEMILQNVNTRLKSLLNEKEIESLISNTSIILGMQNEEALSLAGRGSIQAIILRQKNILADLDSDDSFDIMNLLENKEGVQIINGNELFSSFISGKLSHGDTLIVSTKNLWEQVVENRLLRGIAVLPPNNATELIKNHLTKWREGGATALFIKFCPATNIRKEAKDYSHSTGKSFKNSIDDLVIKEWQTERILTPHPPLNKSFFGAMGNLFGTKNKRKIRPARGGYIEYFLKTFFEQSYHLIKNILILLYKIGRRGFLILINKGDARRRMVNDAKGEFRSEWFIFMRKFNTLPQNSRVFLVIALALIFIFSQSIFVYSIKHNYDKKTEAYNKLVETIKTNADEADASLIYGDTKKAEEMLASAEAILANLPRKTKSQRNQSKYLTEFLNGKLAKMNKVIEIPEPRLIADLGNTKGETLMYSNGNIFILSPENSLMLKMNPENGQISPHASFDSNLVPKLWQQQDKDTAILFSAEQANGKTDIIASGLMKIDSKEIKPLNTSNLAQAIQDVTSFNGRLYILDTIKNQILKSSIINGAFSKNTSWAKEPIDISSALSFTLDGAIYTINNDGTINKFYAGKNTDFSAKIPKIINKDSAIAAAKIWTSENANYIYVLDKTNSRIVVFDKNGKLHAQYVSAGFKDLKDFLVLENEHRIYVLSGTQVLGIIASHIELNQ